MTDWLPVESIYLALQDEPIARATRPWNQSDVFSDVPLSIISRFREDIETADPQRTRRVTAMLLSHPCVLRAGGAGQPTDQQVVAEVRPVHEAQGQREFVAPWDSHFSLFPLPGFRDGVDYAVDFRRVGTTHKQYLEDRRVAVLSHAGWAAMQRRLAYHQLRVDLPLAQRRLETAGSWEELNLWELWIEGGQEFADFQPWLDGAVAGGRYAGQSRRSIVEFAPDIVRAEIPGL